MASEVSEQGHGGKEYNGATLAILTVVLAGVSILVVLVRAAARHRISRVVEATDLLLPVTLLFATAQSIIVRLLLSNTLGRHVTALTDDQRDLFFELIYVSNLLSQLVWTLSQVIIVLLVRQVEPRRPVRIACSALLAIVCLYGTFALSVLAFQCALPTPWLVRASKCVDRQTFLSAFVISNISIDVIMLILPTIMICKFKLPRDKKLYVGTLVGARLVLPIVTIPQLSLLRSTVSSTDPTWDLVPYQMWVQIIMNLSLITACLPSLGHIIWELWAFGSNLRSASPTRLSGSRDFGHELGLEQEEGEEEEEEEKKRDLQYARQTLDPDKKDDWGREVSGRIRQIGSWDSFDSQRTMIDKEKNLPSLPLYSPPRAPPSYPTESSPPPHAGYPSAPRPPLAVAPAVRRQIHHYRRPSQLLSPVLESSPAIGATLPSPLPPRRQWTDALVPAPAPSLAPLESPAAPWDTTSSYYGSDFSDIDIDSYYLDNGQVSRTELVLQSMIEDLQRENTTARSSRKDDGGWI